MPPNPTRRMDAGTRPNAASEGRVWEVVVPSNELNTRVGGPPRPPHIGEHDGRGDRQDKPPGLRAASPPPSGSHAQELGTMGLNGSMPPEPPHIIRTTLLFGRRPGNWGGEWVGLQRSTRLRDIAACKQRRLLPHLAAWPGIHTTLRLQLVCSIR